MKPKWITLILILFIATSLLYAEEEQKTYSPKSKLIYDGRYLINTGKKDILHLEIIFPFYRYLGGLKQGQRINVSNIKTKFTVQYTVKEWIGEYKTMKETFVPLIEPKGPDVGLDVKADLKGDILKIKVSSAEKIQDIFIEILSDISVKISNDRIRYVLSSVGVVGQNLKRGPEADFKLYLITDQPYYKVSIQITYVFQGAVYDKVFSFSFRKEDFTNGSTSP
ncbi:MAG: hypothetical protein AB1629_01155 [Candidatus Omnitrophota bacterium]